MVTVKIIKITFVYQKGSIDTGFGPPRAPLDSTFKETKALAKSSIYQTVKTTYL